MNVLHESIHKGRQSLEGERIVDTGKRTFRLQVTRDAYDFQSEGRVWAWTDEAGWKIVTTVTIDTLPIAPFSYVDRTDGWKAPMQESLDVLERLAVKILPGTRRG